MSDDARRDDDAPDGAPPDAELAARRRRLAAALGGEPADRSRALAALGEAAPADVATVVDAAVAELLVAPLASDVRSEQRRAAESLAALVACAPELAAALERAVESPRARMRWGAAFTIGRAVAIPPASVWPAVREAMSLEDGDQRWAASELACRLARHHAAVLEELRTAVANGSAVLRKMALYCLREVRPPDLAHVGRAALDDPDSGVRLAALAALADGGGERDERLASARAIALRLDEDANPGVRRAAAAALGKLEIHAPEVRAALERAAASADASLARAARDACAKLDHAQP